MPKHTQLEGNIAVFIGYSFRSTLLGDTMRFTKVDTLRSCVMSIKDRLGKPWVCLFFGNPVNLITEKTCTDLKYNKKESVNNLSSPKHAKDFPTLCFH